MLKVFVPLSRAAGREINPGKLARNYNGKLAYLPTLETIIQVTRYFRIFRDISVNDAEICESPKALSGTQGL